VRGPLFFVLPITLLTFPYPGASCAGTLGKDGKKPETKQELPKTLDLKENQKVAYNVEVPADTVAEFWVDGEKNRALALYVYDAQGGLMTCDTRRNKNCYVSWAQPQKQIYRLEMVNLGPGGNRCRLKFSTKTFKRVKFKTIDLKANANQEFKIDFAADKKVHFLVESEKDTDVDLFVFDGKDNKVGADQRLSKDCYVAWIPEKTQTYRLRVENLGNRDNRCHLSYIVEDKGPEKK
jgi:hypothetical protein